MKDKKLVPMAVAGTAIILLAFIILYHGERSGNPAWHIARARQLDPANPANKGGLVKLTGTPEQGLVREEESGKPFVYLVKHEYLFKPVKKTENRTPVPGDGERPATGSYTVDEWVQVNRAGAKAGIITIGKVSIRVGEARLLGKDFYETTVNRPVNDKAPVFPLPGDRKFLIRGLPGDIPLFIAGRLFENTIGTGNIFVVSAYSEGKTAEELSPGLWLRKPLCFLILLIGFILISRPALWFMEKNSSLPVIGFLSKMGWGVFILISVLASFLVVRFSYHTADLVWVITGGILITAGYSVYRWYRNTHP